MPLSLLAVIDATIPCEVADPVNARILAISEDRISGFVPEPFAEIARAAEGLDPEAMRAASDLSAS